MTKPHIALAVVVVACAANHTNTSADARESDEMTVARVVGVSLRERLHGGFVVLPRLFVYSPIAQSSTTSVSTDEQVALLDGLRRGGSAKWVDTGSVHDSVRFGAPAAPRTVVTLAGPIVIDGDTARAAVYISATGRRPGEPVFYTIERYVVARRRNGWAVVRRELVYAT